jgi:GTPase SAR1 family protein
MEEARVRVLILGDSGVGKTCLLHLLCNSTLPKETPPRTIGCNCDTLVIYYYYIVIFLSFHYKSSLLLESSHRTTQQLQIHQYQNREYFVEFCDVGGSERYANARYVFYKEVDGIISIIIIIILIHILLTNISSLNRKLIILLFICSINCKELMNVLLISKKKYRDHSRSRPH